MLIYGANGVIHTKFFSLQQVIELTLDLSPPRGPTPSLFLHFSLKLCIFARSYGFKER